MRIILGLAALAALVPAAAAQAQPAPPGSYRSQCTNIRMEGQFLHATCRGPRGGGQSSINVLSCSTDIGVDANGGLICGGPGVGAGAPPPAYGGPAYGPPVYAPGPGYRSPSGGWGQDAATLYSGRSMRGRSVRLEGAAPNLADIGLNDRVRSIRLQRRSAPWQVCTDAGYRGRCTTIRSSVFDTRRIGMADGISSLRPLRERY